jgi:hypothetical protein
MRKLILMCTVAAVIVMMLAANAMPASAKPGQSVCHTFDHDEFLLATGIDSEYGGTVCDMDWG